MKSFRFLLLAIAIVFSFNLISCGSDDKGDSISFIDSNNYLVGSWYSNYEVTTYKVDTTIYQELTFTSNGYVSIISNTTIIDKEYKKKTTYNKNENSKYEYDSATHILAITHDDGTIDMWQLSNIKEDSFAVKDMIFYRKKSN